MRGPTRTSDYLNGTCHMRGSVESEKYFMVFLIYALLEIELYTFIGPLSTSSLSAPFCTM